MIKYQNVEPASAPTADLKIEGFQVPAQGDAYDFDVTAYCTRTVSPRPRVTIRRGTDGELEELLETVRTTVRQVARLHSVFHAGEAEDAINRELEFRLGGTLSKEPRAVRDWRVRVEVTPPDAVREAMRKQLLERHAIEAQAEADVLRMRKTDELRLLWQRFLDEAAANPTARHAVRLTETSNVIAETLNDIQTERREGAENLLELVNSIADAHQAADILGLVVNSETVLRKTLEMMGVELPPLNADLLLVASDGS